MSNKLPRGLLDLEVSSKLSGGSCVLCRVCLLVEKRVVWESALVVGRGAGLLPVLLSCCGLSCSPPFAFAIEVGIRASAGVISDISGILSG